VCAAEVLLYGLREWWIRERQKGFLEESVLGRKDCPDGTACTRQKILGEQTVLEKNLH
jgi:E3 ubiquitin-protein ligase CHFR